MNIALGLGKILVLGFSFTIFEPLVLSCHLRRTSQLCGYNQHPQNHLVPVPVAPMFPAWNPRQISFIGTVSPRNREDDTVVLVAGIEPPVAYPGTARTRKKCETVVPVAVAATGGSCSGPCLSSVTNAFLGSGRSPFERHSIKIVNETNPLIDYWWCIIWFEQKSFFEMGISGGQIDGWSRLGVELFFILKNKSAGCII